MERFDFYSTERKGYYLLNVQANMLQELDTRVAIPLVPIKYVQKPMRRLNPVFEIENAKVVMHTQFILSVPLSAFKERQGSLLSRYDEIIGALDMLFSGI